MITAASLQSSFTRHAVPIGLALLIALLTLAGDPVRAALAFDRTQLEAGQWWRILSGHFVHLGTYHAALNLLGLLALLVLCPERVSVREWFRRLVLLSLLTSLALYLFAPRVDNYVGLSGVLHGLFLLGLVPMAQRRDVVAIGCLLYLFGKLGWEIVMGAPVSDEQAIGGHVVTQAHLFGTLAAVGYGLIFNTFRKGESTQ